MKKLAICGIFIGSYCEMFPEYYRTLNEKFCTDCDRTFFIFTDRPEITEGLENCKTYVISHACQHYGFILFRKFKYLLMAEDAFLKYDALVFLNGNALCIDTVLLDELELSEDGISTQWHPSKLMMSGRNFDQSICSVVCDPPRKYYQAGFFAAPTPVFLKVANQVESWRMQDKADGKSGSVPWHDESYFNAYLARSCIRINELPYLKFIYPEDVGFDRSTGKTAIPGIKVLLRNKTSGVGRAKGPYASFKNDLY